MSKYAGVPEEPPEYWEIQGMKSGSPQTILLAPDRFYIARINGKQFGLYVDAEGEIYYLTNSGFFCELNRRYRDCVKDVDLNCD